MDKIIEFEKNIFSNLQSEFSKLLNNLKNNKINKDKLDQLIVINKQLLELETNIINLKQNLDIVDKESLKDYEKDKKVIETFKPFMLYHRLLLN